MEKFRVVLTCWDYNCPKPYADDLSGVPLSLFDSCEAAQKAVGEQVEQELIFLNDLDTPAPRAKEPIQDSDGNVVAYDYPFRSDFSGNDAGIVRFWDGDDYQNVTAYNVYPITCDSSDLNKSSYFKYRGFWILPNTAHTSFVVEQFDTPIFKCKNLDKALMFVDDTCLAFEINKSRTPTT